MAFVHRHLQTARQTDAMLRGDALLQRARAIFPGRYDNRRQRALELFHSHPAPHAPLIVQVEAIGGPEEAGCTFLVRAFGTVGGPPMLTRVYVFRPGWPGPGAVRLSVHTLESDPEGPAPPLDLAALCSPAGDLRGRAMTAVLRRDAIVCRTRPIAETPAEWLSVGAQAMHVVSHNRGRVSAASPERPDRLPYRLDRSPAAV